VIYDSSNAVTTIDLEWKVIYVGSAQSEENDQILESIMVGPVPRGTNRFIFEVSKRDGGVALCTRTYILQGRCT
jgi:hypothetical protein